MYFFCSRLVSFISVLRAASLREDAALSLDRVLALEHVVDFVEVVGTGGDVSHLTLGGVVLLQMSLLAEVAHLKHSVSL